MEVAGQSDQIGQVPQDKPLSKREGAGPRGPAWLGNGGQQRNPNVRGLPSLPGDQEASLSANQSFSMAPVLRRRRYPYNKAKRKRIEIAPMSPRSKTAASSKDIGTMLTTMIQRISPLREATPTKPPAGLRQPRESSRTLYPPSEVFGARK